MCLLAPRFISLSQKLSRPATQQKSKAYPRRGQLWQPRTENDEVKGASVNGSDPLNISRAQQGLSQEAALEQYLQGWSALSSLSRVSTLSMQEQLHGYESLCSMWKVSNRASTATAC